MKIIPYETGHLSEMADFGNQEDLVRPLVGMLDATRYEDLGPAFSAVADGRVVASAGLFEVFPHRACVWAIISKQDVAQRFVAIHRETKRFLDNQTYKRIDAQVALGDKAGHRWARMLGFVPEVFCRPYFMPDGSSATEYVRWG